MQEVETRSLAGRLDRSAETAELGRPVRLTQVTECALHRLVGRRGGRVGRVGGLVLTEGTPGLRDLRQALGPHVGQRQVQPDHGEIRDQEVEPLVEGGTALRQQVQVGRAERCDRLDGVDVVASSQQREQVHGLLGEDGKPALLGPLAGQHRGYREFGHVGGGRRVRIPGGAVGQTGQIGKSLAVDCSFRVEDRRHGPLVEHDQDNRRPGAGVAQFRQDRLVGSGSALANPAVEHEHRRHDDRGHGQQESEGADPLETEIGPGATGAGGQRQGHGDDGGQAADRL